jgi:fructose-1,6-bisphosphatase/inositol monophosphatase family enzyme
LRTGPLAPGVFDCDPQLVAELASELRAEVLPLLGTPAAREHAGAAEGGDVTFAIDERAERRMEAFIADRALIEVVAELVDASSVGGATFELGSASYDLTRILSGQLDAYGRPLAERPLLGSTPEFQISCAAAANPELDTAICVEIDAGIERLASITR